MFFLITVAIVVGLDAVAFSFRGRLAAFDTGRWRFPQWILCKERFLNRPVQTPPSLLFLGDSSVTYGIRPALIDRHAFNLSRLALRTCELEELDSKLSAMMPGHPRAIYISFLWFAFVDQDREGDLFAPRPTLPAIAGHFYSRPQLAQGLLPGARLAKYAIESRIEDLRNKQKRTLIIRPDGSLDLAEDKPGTWNVSMPDQLFETSAGWFTPSRLRHFSNYLKIWRDRGVPVFFIFMPMHPALKATLLNRHGEDHRRWKAAVTGLVEGRVIDLEDVLQEPQYFRDSLHLTRDGSRRFSRLLGSRIQDLTPRIQLEPETGE